ncbi:MAG TPA: hypothetical protein DCL80_13055 [Balneola sp.]|jgi:hypothetical protein|nr:hypothetical protein [Balneola sp.]MAO76408.1 hypothetical protein [Balneola sp.]MBF65599.1 hypothetical protein [Balneola sp.]HAH52121.1 hypothetical protein [Balneola sp.]HAW81455.1 hypothetical protein [Balneola sp.]|tara:strand:- start:577 stop:1194 length:618 start_codon:yes stop_codon:yes gene_type:complete
MKTIFLFLISIVFPAVVSAQIQRIESGQYKFAKGEVEITFVDTVSKAYAEEKVTKAGYEIISSDIVPIMFMWPVHIKEMDVSVFESDSLVHTVIAKPRAYDSTAVEEMIVRQNMNKEEATEARIRFREMSEIVWVRIWLQYWVDEETASRFHMEYKDKGFDLNPQMIVPKTMVVKTIPGKENDAMRDLRKLEIVESVAFIALINE